MFSLVLDNQTGEWSCTVNVCDTWMLSLQHQQQGVSLRMFKSLVSRGHPEFSSNRQQDAHEFFLHVINLVEVSEWGSEWVKLNLCAGQNIQNV